MEPVVTGLAALPAPEPHTLAKHKLLRAYVRAWVPILANTAVKFGGTDQIALIDGFAGPGSYESGDPGSPLILLHALLSHPARPVSWAGLRFRFVFIEKEPAFVDALRAQISALGPLPRNVQVDILPGRFEAQIEPALNALGPRAATFAFIDPFGYSNSPMDLTRSLQLGPRVDTLTFVPFDFVTRFVGRAQQEQAMDRLFGCRDWEAATGMTGQRRADYLAALFARQLTRPGQAKHSLMFTLRTLNNNDYRLFFATQHIRGVERMKDAMWKVDPQAGVGFVADPYEGEPVLFNVDLKPDLLQLATTLQTALTGRALGIAELEEWVTLQTGFRYQHLRGALKLLPSTVLTIARPPGSVRGFPPGTRVAFA